MPEDLSEHASTTDRPPGSASGTRAAGGWQRRELIARFAALAATALLAGCTTAPADSNRCIVVGRSGQKGRQFISRPCTER